MGLRISGKTESGFDDPLGLLSDCHRRIERFLEQLLRVTDRARGGDLDEEQRAALAASLRYFRDAAPLHTQDEEESLFPRLRACGTPEADAAAETLARLEADHRAAEAAHAVVERLGTEWLSRGALSEAEVEALSRRLRELGAIYGRHIAVEDREVFPAAGRTLDPRSLAALGAEMARRRGLDPERLPGADLLDAAPGSEV